MIKQQKVLVCLLIVGKSEPLSSPIIASIAQNFQGSILVGFIDQRDIDELTFPPNTIFADLSSEFQTENREYVGFQSRRFYEIVQLKWSLILNAMNLGFETIIYSDLDVVWLRDAAGSVQETFDKFPQVKVLIQSFTRGPALPCLCMGFVAMRADGQTKDFIELCRDTHRTLFLENPMIGDDEVVSKLFADLSYPSWIRELPQSTFPTGNLYPLFLRHYRFRRMESIRPYLFHFNFVIGMDNKLLLWIYLRTLGKLKIGSLGSRNNLKLLWRIVRKKVFNESS